MNFLDPIAEKGRAYVYKFPTDTVESLAPIFMQAQQLEEARRLKAEEKAAREKAAREAALLQLRPELSGPYFETDKQYLTGKSQELMKLGGKIQLAGKSLADFNDPDVLAFHSLRDQIAVESAGFAEKKKAFTTERGQYDPNSHEPRNDEDWLAQYNLTTDPAARMEMLAPSNSRKIIVTEESLFNEAPQPKPEPRGLKTTFKKEDKDTFAQSIFASQNWGRYKAQNVEPVVRSRADMQGKTEPEIQAEIERVAQSNIHAAIDRSFKDATQFYAGSGANASAVVPVAPQRQMIMAGERADGNILAVGGLTIGATPKFQVQALNPGQTTLVQQNGVTLPTYVNGEQGGAGVVNGAEFNQVVLLPVNTTTGKPFVMDWKPVDLQKKQDEFLKSGFSGDTQMFARYLVGTGSTQGSLGLSGTAMGAMGVKTPPKEGVTVMVPASLYLGGKDVYTRAEVDELMGIKQPARTGGQRVQ